MVYGSTVCNSLFKSVKRCLFVLGQCYEVLCSVCSACKLMVSACLLSAYRGAAVSWLFFCMRVLFNGGFCRVYLVLECCSGV